MISENPCWRGKVSDHCSIRTCHLWRAVDAGVVIWSFKMHLFHTGSVCIWHPYACFKIARKSEVPTPVTRNIGQRHTYQKCWPVTVRHAMGTPPAPSAGKPWGGAAGGIGQVFSACPAIPKGVIKSRQKSSRVIKCHENSSGLPAMVFRVFCSCGTQMKAALTTHPRATFCGSHFQFDFLPPVSSLVAHEHPNIQSIFPIFPNIPPIFPRYFPDIPQIFPNKTSQHPIFFPKPPQKKKDLPAPRREERPGLLKDFLRQGQRDAAGGGPRTIGIGTWAYQWTRFLESIG